MQILRFFMAELTQKEKNKLLAAAEIVQNGDLAVLKKILEFQDFIENKEAEVEALTTKVKNEIETFKEDLSTQIKDELKNIKEEVKPVLGVDYQPEAGKDYVLTETDKEDIAQKIKVPVVEKVIERIETIKETPLVTEKIITNQIENPITAEQVRDKLETLIGDERLDKSAVKGLDEALSALDKKIAVKSSPGGMRKVPIVKKYRLTDQCNGVLKSFTLPADTTEVLGVFGTQFPVNFDPYNSSGGDWTLVGRTLTLGSGVSAPETGQTLWCLIETLFY